MADIAPTYLDGIVDYLRGAGAPPAISAIYLDLYDGDPQGAGVSVLTDLTGSATRADISAAMAAASGGISANSTTITVTTSALAVATISYAALFTASTGGALIMSNALSSAQVTAIGDLVRFDAGELEIELN